MRTLLLDADILAYKIASAAQTTTQFPGCEAHVELEPWADVERHCWNEVEAVCERLDSTKVIVCLSVPTAEGWRVNVLPTYKAHRDPAAKPVLLGKVKDYLASQWTPYTRPTLEADDVMGILSTHPYLIPGEKVIVSDDKDMGTIPGLWFRPGWVGGSGDSFVRTVSREDADRFHLMQTICGDTVDGYKGCPGAGPDKAEPVLNGLRWVSRSHTLKSGPRKGTVETRWELAPTTAPTWRCVVSLFEKHGLTEEDALVQARVARICRHTDYDFKNKQVRLWTPDSYLPQPEATTASTASTEPCRKAA